MQTSSRLLARITKRLESALNSGPAPTLLVERPDPAAYEKATDSVLQRASQLQAEVARNRELVATKYADLTSLPDGRVSTLIKNSAPATLLAMTHDLMRRSFAARFVDADQSLQLAELGTKVTEAVAKTAYLSAASVSDLRAEALLYLGNARRLASDVGGAEAALGSARMHIYEGTRDRQLRATHLSFLGSLLLRQRRIKEAARAFDSEIRLRRILADSGGLGAAYINRGVVATYTNDAESACRLLREGVLLVEDDGARLIALLSLADSLARSDRGTDAWIVICRLEAAAMLASSDIFSSRISWLKGIAHFAMGSYHSANDCLLEAEKQLMAEGCGYAATIASLDRACVLTALGNWSELRVVSAKAHRVMTVEQFEPRAIAAFVLLLRAVESEQLTVDLAVRVANFFARSRYDRDLRFEWKEK